MKLNKLLLLLIGVLFLPVISQAQTRIIFDTDFGIDADDHSLLIVTVGPLKNIENLLGSVGDSISR